MTIDGYEDVPSNDIAALKKAIAHQPVAVAICATMSMQVGPGGPAPPGLRGSNWGLGGTHARELHLWLAFCMPMQCGLCPATSVPS